MRKSIRSLLYGLFIIALFTEWMSPLKWLTDTGRVDIFILAFSILLLIDAWRLPLWAGIVGKPLLLVLIIYAFFFAPVGFSLFDANWVLSGWQTMRGDSQFLRSAEWMQMTPLGRTACFLTFIWLMETVMFRYVVRGRRIFWIFLLTVIYLSVLDSFTPFDGRAAVVRTFCYGFVMLAVGQLDHLFSRESPRQGRATTGILPWLSAGVAFIFLATSIGLVAPKSAASWQGPVSLIPSIDERGKGLLGGDRRKVGYSDDDSRLGGPFTQDETVVFQSLIEVPYYWRGEAKDLYDGHGWHRQQKDLHDVARVHQSPGYYDVESALFHDLEKKRVTQQTDFADGAEGKYSVLFTAGQVKRIYTVQSLRDNAIVVTGNQSGYRLAEDTSLTSYKIDVEQPIINEEQLQNSTSTYPDEIQEQYLQLPDRLPERVTTLGKEIIKDEATVYEQVRAIESYLQLGPDFVYETDDVPVPPEESDFVDHFLFETQRGYCDHFSTAMVVLLRANGIPARWVKGFAPGEQQYDLDKEAYEVTVTNAHAHSWPEVYFEGAGWLPFEPTPGFTNPTNIAHDLDEVEVDGPAAEELESDIPDVEQFDDIQLDDEDIFPADPDDSGPGVGWQPTVISTVVGMILLGGGLWMMRPRLWQWRLNRLGDGLQGDTTDRMVITYERLLALLGKRYGPRKPQQTVRDYVQSLTKDGEKLSDPLIELTKSYERFRYHRSRLPKEVWQVIRERWKRLIRELRL